MEMKTEFVNECIGDFATIEVSRSVDCDLDTICLVLSENPVLRELRAIRSYPEPSLELRYVQKRYASPCQIWFRGIEL
jgi:hypothetical protein